MSLLIALAQKQRRLMWRDAEMARRLGISRSLWCDIKKGRRNLGPVVVRGVLRLFPEMTDEVLTHIAQQSKQEMEAQREQREFYEVKVI